MILHRLGIVFHSQAMDSWLSAPARAKHIWRIIFFEMVAVLTISHVFGCGGAVLFLPSASCVGVGVGLILVGWWCTLLFFPPLAMVHSHAIRLWNVLLFGGPCVRNCGPGVLCTPFKISRSLASMPRLIRGGTKMGVWWLFGSCSRFGALLGHFFPSSPCFNIPFRESNIFGTLGVSCHQCPRPCM